MRLSGDRFGPFRNQRQKSLWAEVEKPARPPRNGTDGGRREDRSRALRLAGAAATGRGRLAVVVLGKERIRQRSDINLDTAQTLSDTTQPCWDRESRVRKARRQCGALVAHAEAAEPS
ncbi:unnamed protein product, partial [Iphiclides podalirius]